MSSCVACTVGKLSCLGGKGTVAPADNPKNLVRVAGEVGGGAVAPLLPPDLIPRVARVDAAQLQRLGKDGAPGHLYIAHVIVLLFSTNTACMHKRQDILCMYL